MITNDTFLQPVIEQTNNADRRVSFTTSLSRGCPSSCRFCSNHLSHGRRFRHCSIERFEGIIRDLPLPAAHSGISINFEDDNLLYDYPFFIEMINRCRSVFPGVRFTAENGLDYRLMSPVQCEELIDAGFSQLNFTLGSTSKTVLNHADRDLDAERFDTLLSITTRRGIPVISYIICGFPEDTKTSIAGNLLFLMERRTIIGVSLFYPVPGIAGFVDRTLFDKTSPQRCTGSAAYPWGGSCDTATLLTAFRLARFINLTKAKTHSGEERALIEQTIRTGKLHTIIKEHGKRRIIEVPLQDVELSGMVLSKYSKSA
jgi:radical SAM superfamily enzyme YgiQ (UPF0313 family)